MIFWTFVLVGCADESTKPISDNSAAITEAGSKTDSAQALATETDAEESTCPQVAEILC